MSEPSELVLSASSLKTWLNCGRRYWYEQVLRLPSAPTMEMTIGTATHAGVEAHHNGQDALEATESAFGREYEGMDHTGGDDPAAGLHDATAMLALYRENIAPTFHPTIVERDFLVRLNGVLVSGRIDAADDDVHDTKTTATLSRFRPERHRLQMTLYRHGFRTITGRWPGRLLLDVIARNLRWKTVEVEHDDGELADVLALASRGILGGVYDPTGALNGSCSRCSFWRICEFAVTD